MEALQGNYKAKFGEEEDEEEEVFGDVLEYQAPAPQMPVKSSKASIL